ncbi:MAG TPA: P27 family phage terminase small subunit [Nitrospiraceae bacterium]|nr:P27 family phage terminase small subunit [Nitrospiraceae bacterium]
MRGGSNRKSARRKRLSGTLRRRRKKNRGVTSSAKTPQARLWLKGLALGKWRELAPLLLQRGVLTALDWDLLATACMHWRFMVEAGHAVDSVNMRNAKGRLVKHPALQVFRQLGGVSGVFY